MSNVVDQFNKVQGLNVSNRYTVINSTDLVKRFESEGYTVSKVTKARCKNPLNEGFQRHEIRLRRAGLVVGLGGLIPEIIIQNSYDGKSPCKILMGLFRLVCLNGLTVGNRYEQLSVRHVGDIMPKVLIACERVALQVGAMESEITSMQSRILTLDEIHAFSRVVLNRLYPEINSSNLITNNLLDVHRPADQSYDLFTVLNVVQENALMGGLKYTSTNTQGEQVLMKTGRVRAIERSTKINQVIWSAASELLAA